MIIKFKQSYSETKANGNSITEEQIQGVVTSIIYQRKIFEIADLVKEDIIFDLAGQKYNFSQISNIVLITKENDGKLKTFEISKNEITKKIEMNGSTYDNLKELYYDLSLV